MNRQSQWLFEAPFVSESDRYTNQEYHRESKREANEGPFTLAMRGKIDFIKEGKKAAERIVRGKELKEEYQRNCSGVDVVKTLSRESLSPSEKV